MYLYIVYVHCILTTCFWFVSFTFGEVQQYPTKRPNFIILLADDLGYGDLVSYGNPSQEFGPIDQLALEGMRFTQMYSADSLCTPSRAAILTGRLPIRLGISGPSRIFFPFSKGGLPRNETTIAEALKKTGYTTGMVGKWHLGINKESAEDGYHLPIHHGFDFVGSNLPFTTSWKCDELKIHKPEPEVKFCFLYYGQNLIQQPIKVNELTHTFVSEAISFIEKNQNNPFFFYFSFHQIHVAFHAAKQFHQSSVRGPLGDSINEMSWAVGEIISTLRKLHLDEQTLVFFLSDHGPHVEMCLEGGSTGGLSGGKSNSFDGGLRIPAIAWWPKTIQPGKVSSALTSSMDIFSTILDFANQSTINKYNDVDGKSLKLVLLGRKETVHSILFHYCSETIMAVRYKTYKLVYYTQKLVNEDYFTTNCTEGIPLEDTFMSFQCLMEDLQVHTPPLIFNIVKDYSERYPLLASKYKSLIEEVDELIRLHKKGILPVPSQTESFNSELIPCCDPPKCTCNYYENSSISLHT